ncbi:unnamed protein product [Microthlaspi erraticum]|uniref:Reverse transcriptase zinc-binding domain-containing protein n=1 Tax=Microthlaspi erraticum TaxID=1685480 RepID=A0A6D2HST6_9BRAS|nr:unnamed protein product [Microthlaspi erraticum]
MTIKSSRRGAPDAFIWLPTKSGEYSVKTGYHSALALHENLNDPHNLQNPFNWMSEIWNGKFSPKMKVFLWKVLQEALPIGENLLNRGILESSCCTHCGELETTEHLFFHCPYAVAVWNLAPFSNDVNPTQLQTFPTTLTLSKTWISLPPIGAGQGPLFPWICWSIWKACNYLLFEERLFKPEETIQKAILEAKD